MVISTDDIEAHIGFLLPVNDPNRPAIKQLKVKLAWLLYVIGKIS